MMRLTRILFKEKWRLHKKLIFQRKGVYKPVPLPQGLDETGKSCERSMPNKKNMYGSGYTLKRNRVGR